jgi:hypothetical protein
MRLFFQPKNAHFHSVRGALKAIRVFARKVVRAKDSVSPCHERANLARKAVEHDRSIT